MTDAATEKKRVKKRQTLRLYPFVIEEPLAANSALAHNFQLTMSNDPAVVVPKFCHATVVRIRDVVVNRHFFLYLDNKIPLA
ncbi:Hypothetical protein HEAR0677 [Herminiimonas arsenicoxydans]|uniref:Uncharacterized protein n=1 Tax=Herminiimonas arsenicoxydans TaxID=204773 RepID=A4G2Y4_HERAR|nr:Hypothetical protein HEAR0677 [Herminiimonas arsenicoxydans]